MTLRTLDSLGSLAGKRVVVRCDLNVPLEGSKITDDGRVRASIPTLNALINQGAKVVVISHLGRPEGAPDAKYSLAPVAQRLSELLGKPVTFAKDTVGGGAADAVAALTPLMSWKLPSSPTARRWSSGQSTRSPRLRKPLPPKSLSPSVSARRKQRPRRKLR